MGNKKHSKKHQDETSTDSDSSDSDSSSSSSDSSDSPPASKKTKKDVKVQDKSEKERLSSSKKGGKHLVESEEYTSKASSKWDSPQERIDHKKEKKTEKVRTSSADRDVKNDAEKEQELEHRRKDQGYSKQKDYSRDRRYDRRDRKYDDRDEQQRDRNDRNDDRNRRRNDRDYSSKRYSYDRNNSSEQKDYDRNDRSYNSRKSNEDRGYQNKYRNRRHRSRSASLEGKDVKWGKGDDSKSSNKSDKSKDKEKPNFSLSGKLTEETNTYRGFVIKYSEPPEARKPKRRWRLYPFKGEKALQTLYIHRESAYLIGRERKIVDLPVDHPSCSKQHAVLQYRLVPFTREDGSTGKRVRPYLIDLDSANGTFINNKKIDPKKYVELLEKDVIKFGYSSREYVLLHENSKDEAQDDDVKDEVYEPVKKEKD
ncbi:FHA domain [Popillia japonica]|uniref:FHA domain n=1 Tax=Popillia japonica TaxID=7064 RepID=A0AAW1JU97_POPJA